MGVGGAVAQTAGGGPSNSNAGAGPNNGPPDYRYQSGLPAAASGRGGMGSAGVRSPYGRIDLGHRSFSDSGFGFDRGLAGNPLDPQWSGLIEQNFEVMRRTSPFPNSFAGGVYNPRGFGHHFRPGYGGFYNPSFGSFAYGGYAFGYGPGVYGAYVPSVYSAYGSWYPPYLPTDHVYIIDREVVRDAPRVEEGQPDDRAPVESGKTRTSDDADYYLAPRSGESVDDAIADIRHAWMNGDYARLKSRMRAKGKVRIYLKGKYKYSVDAPDFEQMTRDAMTRIDTVSFSLDRVQRQGDDRVFAGGKHVYYDPDHQKQEVYVSYGLVKEDGRWKIAEAGSSTEPITTHSD